MAIFTSFGPVKSISIVKDNITGISRGYAFVKMTEAINAKRVVSERKGKTVAGRRLVLRALF